MRTEEWFLFTTLLAGQVTGGGPGSVLGPCTPLPDKTFSISSKVMANYVIKRVLPSSQDLPPCTRARVVRVHLTIGKNGTVENAALTSGKGSDIFDRAIITTARQWQFKPYILNCAPARVETDIEMKAPANGADCPSRAPNI
jgi:TonB family protein